MCGIIGELSSSQIDRDTFRQMRDELSHRGPDGADMYFNHEENLALGFRRLSIIDLTDAGLQPLVNEDESCYLLFNGEIYNYRDLRTELQTAGHEFTSETDSEVILHGYEEWGTSVTERLRGMFAFAIWDEQEGQLVLARDPFGIKPLVYYEGEDRFIFASELKGILADDTIPREVSPGGLNAYFRYRYIPAPLTIWENMYKLPPGTILINDGEETEVESYWRLDDYVSFQSPSQDEARVKVQSRLHDSITSHLVSDVPVGVLLSGGIDSSLIAALASKSNDSLVAFSMGFEGTEDELAYAELVAEEFDLSHTTRELRSTHLDDLLDEILYTYDEPLADNSIFPTYLLMREAGRDMKVVLSGDGGDEIFGGYTWYDRYLYFQRLNPVSKLVKPLYRTVRHLNGHLQSDLVHSLEWRLRLASFRGFEQYQAGMHTPLDTADRDLIFSDEYTLDSSSPGDVEQYASEYMNMKDLQYLDFHSFLPYDILTKVDRASMAHSLEVRVPLLDKSIVEYIFSLNDTVLHSDNKKKQLLKDSSRDILPDSIIDRQKSGFGAPISQMGFIEDYEEVLRDSQAAADGIFTQDGIDNYLDGQPQSNNVFKLILFELWYRRWRP